MVVSGPTCCAGKEETISYNQYSCGEEESAGHVLWECRLLQSPVSTTPNRIDEKMINAVERRDPTSLENRKWASIDSDAFGDIS